MILIMLKKTTPKSSQINNILSDIKSELLFEENFELWTN